MQSVSQPEEKRHVPELSESEEKVPEMETDSLPPSTGKDDEEEKKPETVSEGVCSWSGGKRRLPGVRFC